MKTNKLAITLSVILTMFVLLACNVPLLLISGVWIDEEENIYFALDQNGYGEVDENVYNATLEKNGTYQYAVDRSPVSLPDYYESFIETYYFNLTSVNTIEGFFIGTYTIKNDDGTLTLSDMVQPFVAYRKECYK
jgi:hypothetical protein